MTKEISSWLPRCYDGQEEYMTIFGKVLVKNTGYLVGRGGPKYKTCLFALFMALIALKKAVVL